ncbi:MAG: hemerythrin family protein [Firmicutes bacterium]|nr:hemerythrin family protein [Bacillota bacterium]
MMWKEKYKIGVELIDQQHEELFRRVSDFIGTVRSENPWDTKLSKIKETLEFMNDYVITHFRDEEEYQAKINYPGLEKHKKIHDDFKAEVVEFVRLFEETGFDEDLVQRFSGKLLAWLINHVAGIDQKIGEFARKQEVPHHES